MGLSHSPSVILDNIVFYIDPGNTKSYAGSGTSVSDLSPNNYTATLNGTITFDNNTFNLGAAQNITNYIQIPNGVITGIADFTLSLWCYPLDLSTLNSPFNATIIGGNDFGIEWYPTYIQTLMGTTYSTFSFTGVNNNWYNIVFYRSGSYMGLVLNGEDKGTVPCPTTIHNITGAILLGQEQDGIKSVFDATQSYRGKYGPVAFYNKALSPQQIKQNFNALRGRFGV